MISLKRRISTFILLSVLLPIVFVAPFHHHDENLLTDIPCEDCSHHQPHPGHLGNKTGAEDCFLCQLLAQLFIPSVGPVLNLLSSDSTPVFGHLSDAAVLCFTHHSSPRAPPVSF